MPDLTCQHFKKMNTYWLFLRQCIYLDPAIQSVVGIKLLWHFFRWRPDVLRCAQLLQQILEELLAACLQNQAWGVVLDYDEFDPNLLFPYWEAKLPHVVSDTLQGMCPDLVSEEKPSGHRYSGLTDAVSCFLVDIFEGFPVVHDQLQNNENISFEWTSYTY